MENVGISFYFEDTREIKSADLAYIKEQITSAKPADISAAFTDIGDKTEMHGNKSQQINYMLPFD